MRTTVSLDVDAERVISAYRAQHGGGLSEAVNELIRRAASERPRIDYVYPTTTFELGAKVPLDSTSRLLDLLDEEEGS